jgi:hypothetical protein
VTRLQHTFADEAEGLQRNRVVIVNLWRPIKSLVLDVPASRLRRA